MTEIIPLSAVEDDIGGAPSFIPASLVEDDIGTSFSNELLGVGNRAVEGSADLLDLLEKAERNLNPFRFGGPRAFGLNENQFNTPPVESPGEQFKNIATKAYLYGDEQPTTPVGQILGEVAYNAPAMLLPGGTTATGIKSLVAGGLASGVARASGAGEGVQAVSGILGAFAPATISSFATKAKSVLDNVFSTAAKKEDAALAARDLIEKVTGKDKVISALEDAAQAETKTPFIQRQSANYLPQYQRTAELVEDPALAALEETMRRTDDTVKQAATLQDALREDARASIYKKANPNEMLDSKAGTIIREGLEVNKKSAGEAVTEFSKKAFIGGEELPAKAAKGVVTATLNAFTKDGSRKVTNEFNDLVQNFRALPSKVDLQTLQNYRSAFGDYAQTGLGASTQERITARIAGNMRKAIENSVDKAIASGDLSKSQANAWKNMLKARAEKGATFEGGAVGDILEKNPFNAGYVVAAEDVPNKVLSTKEDVLQLLKGLKGQTNSIEAARSSLLSHVWEKSTNAMTGSINPSTFHRQLNLISETAPEILTKTQLKALTKIGEDLASQATVKSSAYAASKNQSITSEAGSTINIIQEAVKEATSSAGREAISKIPIIGGVLDSLINIVSDPKQRQALLNKELANFVLDPKYALALMKKPDKESVSVLTEFSKRLSGTLSTVASSGSRLQQSEDTKTTTLIKNVLGQKQPETKPVDNNKTEEVIKESPVSEVELDAVRYVESSDGKYLTSPKGAKGEYQFMPATAKAYGVNPNDKDYSDDRRGARELLEDEFLALGDKLLAYAAYNAGRPAVLDAIKKAKSRNYDDVEKYLPDETRDYVQKIIAAIQLKSKTTQA